MSELARIGCLFYEDLVMEPAVGSALASDHQSLTKEVFIARHTQTIQQRYASLMRLELSPEEAAYFAACIWDYLDMLQTNGERTPLVLHCCPHCPAA